jgi:hypothetical protein
MKRFRIVAATAAALITVGFAGAAIAQLGTYQLPNNNFVWRWGDENGRSLHRAEDLEVSGGEAGFRCDLTAAISPGSHLTPNDVRQIQQQLSSAIDFIYKSTMLMNDMHNQRQIDWAMLSCARPEATPSTEAQKAEHEQKAREKMQKEIEKRRAKQPSSTN